jgi:MFS family permease
MLAAAAAMVGTLPGRTQGLGLITEGLLKSLRLGPVPYAQINLWATLIGSLFCIGIGRLQDRVGSRIVSTVTVLLLGIVVLAMSRVTTLPLLFFLITLTRGLGQSALSVISLTMTGQWFKRRLNTAMAIYTVVMSIGFMIAFPVIGSIVTLKGWRVAWADIGWALILALAPLLLLLVRRSPEAIGLSIDGEPAASGMGNACRGAAVPSANARTANLQAIAASNTTDLTGEPAQESATFLEALGTGAFWVMATASAMYGLIASGIGLFNESILKARGLDPAVYHTTLAITAITALAGNFLGGYLASKGAMNRLMSAAMLLLTISLAALPSISAVWHAIVLAVIMGVAGGFVMVLFFSFWGHVYGRRHLGMIQGAAQTLTVIASAVGPLILAECVDRTRSYAFAFYLLAGVVAVLAIASWVTPVPSRYGSR